MSTEVISCTPDMDLGRVGWLMWEGDCGALPVIRAGRVVGMITDRDVCLAAAMKPRPCSEIQVAEAMGTTDPAFVRPASTLEEALALMERRRVRRLPVVDGDDRLVGILSLNDVVRKTGAAASHRILATLRAIAEPRLPATI
jgi:CBS domain-containing protein